eukprot:scaffold60022_cov35-Tisochrysis_lutea.AAC.3
MHSQSVHGIQHSDAWALAIWLGHHQGATVTAVGKSEASFFHTTPTPRRPRAKVANCTILMLHATWGTDPEVVGSRNVSRDAPDSSLLHRDYLCVIFVVVARACLRDGDEVHPHVAIFH